MEPERCEGGSVSRSRCVGPVLVAGVHGRVGGGQILAAALVFSVVSGARSLWGRKKMLGLLGFSKCTREKGKVRGAHAPPH